MTNFAKVRSRIPEFRRWLREFKEHSVVDFEWYPYETVGGLNRISPIIPEAIDHLFDGNRDIADIGAADGAMAFFLETLGNRCDIYDYAPTNFNHLKGANYLKGHLSSKVNIYSIDLDSQFKLEKKYDLILLLGIFYHLKNPYYVLEFLAHQAQYLCFSTRITKTPYRGGPDISSLPLSYLVGPAECNNDATNYWIFTEAGLKRIFDRTGWNVMSFQLVGDTEESNPQEEDHRGEAWAVLESKVITR